MNDSGNIRLFNNNYYFISFIMIISHLASGFIRRFKVFKSVDRTNESCFDFKAKRESNWSHCYGFVYFPQTVSRVVKVHQKFLGKTC